MNIPAIKNNFRVLIPDGEKPIAHYIIICLAQIPDITISIMSDIRFASCRFSRHIKNFYYRPFKDDEDRIEQIIKTAAEDKTDIILPVDESAISLLSKSKQRFFNKLSHGLFPDYDSFNICINKNQFAKFLKNNCLPTPKTHIYEFGASHQEFSNFSYPILAKPIIGTDGAGIRKINDEESLKLFLDKIDEPGNYIYQSYIEGYDIDCSVLCKDGKIVAYTIQKGFYKRKNSYKPSRGIEFIKNEEVFNLASKLVSELNWSGVAHIDLRFSNQDGQFKILEANPRYWGSLLGSLISGINFPYLSCLCTLGHEIPLGEYRCLKYIPFQRVSKLWKENYKDNGKYNFGFEQTNFRYIAKDPLPDIISQNRFLQKQIAKLFKSLFHK